MILKHFKPEEVAGLQDALVERLELAREAAGMPFIITRGKSTAEHNAEVGGVQDSAHLTGLAVDLACEDSHTRFLMLKGLISSRFTRIGVYEKHLHCDVDAGKAPEVIWMGHDA